MVLQNFLLSMIYAQNAYRTWNSTINSRTILKPKALDKMIQKIENDTYVK